MMKIVIYFQFLFMFFSCIKLKNLNKHLLYYPVNTLFPFCVNRDTTTIVKKLKGIEIIPGLLKGIGAKSGLRP